MIRFAGRYFARPKHGPVLHDEPQREHLPKAPGFVPAERRGSPVTRSERIKRVACLMFGITEEEIMGRGRARTLTSARLYAAARMRRELGLTTTQIGRLLGRHHSVVVRLLQKARQD